MSPICKITFTQGTLLITADREVLELIDDDITFDPRIQVHRAQAYCYERIVRKLTHAGIAIEDNARNYTKLELKPHTNKHPMSHQALSLQRWQEAKGRGIVVMPTGSGKTFFAMLAMQTVQRSTLVVVPTIDLMQQWTSQLEQMFECKVGMLGGGSHDVLPITVSTYDSAVLQMQEIGNQFGLIIFDECHHLPGEVNRTAASMCIAPYRLGLSATPERDDEGNATMEELIGKIVSRINIDDLEGSVLSPYRTEQIFVDMSEEEMAEYNTKRKMYVDFIRRNNINFAAPDGWQRFLITCARTATGKEVLHAWMRQREIARCSSAKMDALWQIMLRHNRARIIIFTADNDTAYKIGETFCLPVITHKTSATERKSYLDHFRTGEFSVLVTSKVLNEGVDVPEASVGIVVSGSACTREHIQRLGRILRRTTDGKQAILYELVSYGTSEMNVSERRRNNRAYQMGGGQC